MKAHRERPPTFWVMYREALVWYVLTGAAVGVFLWWTLDGFTRLGALALTGLSPVLGLGWTAYEYWPVRRNWSTLQSLRQGTGSDELEAKPPVTVVVAGQPHTGRVVLYRRSKLALRGLVSALMAALGALLALAPDLVDAGAGVGIRGAGWVMLVGMGFMANSWFWAALRGRLVALLPEGLAYGRPQALRLVRWTAVTKAAVTLSYGFPVLVLGVARPLTVAGPRWWQARLRLEAVFRDPQLRLPLRDTADPPHQLLAAIEQAIVQPGPPSMALRRADGPPGDTP